MNTKFLAYVTPLYTYQVTTGDHATIQDWYHDENPGVSRYFWLILQTKPDYTLSMSGNQYKTLDN